MLYSDYTVFGHHTESRAFAPPRGGIDPPFSNLNYATQVFARPAAATRTYILGVLYRDLDGSGDWTPRDSHDLQREGLGSVSFTLYAAETGNVVATGVTMENGAFSVNCGSGTYDLVFTGVGTPGGTLRIENITVAGQNVDVGDHDVLAIAPADLNGDAHVDLDDVVLLRACMTRMHVPYNPSNPPAGCAISPASGLLAADLDRDQDVDMDDFAILQKCYSGAQPAARDCAD